jgi:Ca2+-binding RTX toxin-like protein
VLSPLIESLVVRQIAGLHNLCKKAAPMKITVAIRAAVAVAVLVASQASGTAQKKIQTTRVQATANTPVSGVSFDYGGGTDGPYEASVYLGGRNGRTLHIYGTQEDDLILVSFTLEYFVLSYRVSITDDNTGVDRLGDVGSWPLDEVDLVVIHGLDGDDRIVNTGGFCPDMIYGGLGDDTIMGGGMDSFLYGQDGKDSIHGGNGNDIIFGEVGDDILVGEGGCDIIDGGPDNDRIGGGYFPENSSTSAILGSDDETTDFVTGGSGNDRFYPAASDWVDFDSTEDVDVLD